jgi:predicted SAM-dependent methyltransferase
MVDLSGVLPGASVRVIIGAGEQRYPGWIATQREDLDLLKRSDFVASFSSRLASAFLCEHVWEHLTLEEGRRAAALCFEFLEPGGYLRCAVPDGNFRDPPYRRLVQVGGPGPADHPAADHRVLYDHRLFTEVFGSARFDVELLEHCDEHGRFHHRPWDPADGPTFRSWRSGPRNAHGELRFVSIIADLWKR